MSPDPKSKQVITELIDKVKEAKQKKLEMLAEVMRRNASRMEDTDDEDDEDEDGNTDTMKYIDAEPEQPIPRQSAVAVESGMGTIRPVTAWASSAQSPLPPAMLVASPDFSGSPPDLQEQYGTVRPVFKPPPPPTSLPPSSSVSPANSNYNTVKHAPKTAGGNENSANYATLRQVMPSTPPTSSILGSDTNMSYGTARRKPSHISIHNENYGTVKVGFNGSSNALHSSNNSIYGTPPPGDPIIDQPNSNYGTIRQASPSFPQSNESPSNSNYGTIRSASSLPAIASEDKKQNQQNQHQLAPPEIPSLQKPAAIVTNERSSKSNHGTTAPIDNTPVSPSTTTTPLVRRQSKASDNGSIHTTTNNPSASIYPSDSTNSLVNSTEKVRR